MIQETLTLQEAKLKDEPSSSPSDLLQRNQIEIFRCLGQRVANIDDIEWDLEGCKSTGPKIIVWKWKKFEFDC